MGLSFAGGVTGSGDHHVVTPVFTSERAVVALRSALQARLAAPQRDDSGFRHALRLMGADARRRGVRVEQMIVVL